MNIFNRHRQSLLIAGIVLMLLASGLRMKNEFSRLIFDPTFSGATDLKLRYQDVHRWFSGQPVYADKDAIYPPATYLMLWPFLGWLSLPAARWFWALTSVLAMLWLISIVVKESKASTPLETLFTALLVPSVYSTGATIGNGQLILHLLPFLITSLLLLNRKDSNYFLIAVFFVVAMMKPAIAVPFFWIVLFVPRTFKPALLAGAGYSLITIVAIAFQPQSFSSLITEWLARGSAAAVRGGYANVHGWLAAIDLQSFILPVSLALLLLLGLWVYFHRQTDTWILIGVTAIFARLWVYHRLYDDLLLLLPLIALFRTIAIKEREQPEGAIWIFALLWAAALGPARWLAMGPPWSVVFEAGQLSAWIVTLVYLTHRSRLLQSNQGRAGVA